MNDNAQLCRDYGFNAILRERVIAEDVALHEIVDIEVGARMHRDIHWEEVVSHTFAREGIEETERAAEGVLLGNCGCSLFGGNKLHDDTALLLRIQRSITIGTCHIVV